MFWNQNVANVGPSIHGIHMPDFSLHLLVGPVGVGGGYLGDGEDVGADDGLVRALHVLEVEDDGVLQQRQEDEHDARQQPYLI